MVICAYIFVLNANKVAAAAKKTRRNGSGLKEGDCVLTASRSVVTVSNQSANAKTIERVMRKKSSTESFSRKQMPHAVHELGFVYTYSAMDLRITSS